MQMTGAMPLNDKPKLVAFVENIFRFWCVFKTSLLSIRFEWIYKKKQYKKTMNSLRIHGLILEI